MYGKTIFLLVKKTQFRIDCPFNQPNHSVIYRRLWSSDPRSPTAGNHISQSGAAPRLAPQKCRRKAEVGQYIVYADTCIYNYIQLYIIITYYYYIHIQYTQHVWKCISMYFIHISLCSCVNLCIYSFMILCIHLCLYRVCVSKI